MNMKNYCKFLLVMVLVNVISLAHAHDEKYIETMQKNIDALYQAKDIPTLQGVVNTLDRIASVEKGKWEPQYYIAYGYVMMAFREADAAKKDSYLDRAMEAVNKGKEILPNDSEIAALEGFINMARVTIDPATRGPQYAGLAMQLYGKASALNPENPRALVLMAQMQYGTAEFFGSPTTEACATLQAALQKFDTYKSENKLAPTWGRGMAEGMKEKCK
jgi:hypothetical protein